MERALTWLAGGMVWLAIVLGSFGQEAAAREPVPFTDAYRDGFAFVTWADEEPVMREKLARIRQSGATHLVLPYFGCQSDIRSSDVGSCQVTYGISGKTLARLAIQEGFPEVSYLPIVVTPDWKWRGFFDPIDVAGWFRTYTTWIKDVARDAKSLGMEELIVSTETTLLYRHEAQWRQVLSEVRTEFDGPLILTVNWGDTNHSFWDAADAIGVSAYYPLSMKDNPSQEELDAAWRARREEFVALSKKWNRPIHITEVGYQSVVSAAKTPWAGAPGDASDVALQARCFEAFAKAWSGERALVRANVWATSVEDPALSYYPFSFETLGKPAEAVLSRFFAERLTLNPLFGLN